MAEAEIRIESIEAPIEVRVIEVDLVGPGAAAALEAAQLAKASEEAAAASAGEAAAQAGVIRPGAASNRLFEFLDALHRIVAYIDDAGTWFVATIAARFGYRVGEAGRALLDDRNPDTIVTARDAGGRRYFAVDKEGVRAAAARIDRVAVDTINGTPAASLIDAFGGATVQMDATTREIILSQGQSLSIGTGASANPAGPYAPAVLTADQPYGNLMLSSGVRFWSGTPTGLVNHIESVNGTSDAGETILGGFQAFLMQVLTELGLAPADHALRTIALASGQGETAISAFLTGGSMRTRLMSGVNAAVGYATGQTIKCRQNNWLQGETLPSPSTYADDLVTLAGQVDSVIRGATGQTDRVLTVVNQIDRPVQALAALTAARASPLVQIGCPQYPFPVNGFVGLQYDNVHRSARGYALMGATLVLPWIANNLFKRPWRPLQLKKDARGSLFCRKDGSDLVIEYDVPFGGGIEFADRYDGVAFPRRQRGIYMFASGGTEKVIRDVVIEGKASLRLVGCSPAAGDILRIGFRDPTSTTAASVATNIRDRLGDRLRFRDLGSAPICNWAIAEQHTLTSSEVA